MNTTPKNSKADDLLDDAEIKLYKRRWLMLAIFLLCSGSNNLQYIQYGIIADTVVRYYGVSYIAVNWTAMVFLLLYIIFLWPGMYILEKMGLRITVLAGMFGTCAGAWVKVASVSPDRFWILMLGQSLVGVSQIFLVGLPSRLAAVWFGPKEVSSACATAIIGMQIGNAMGYFISPLFVEGAQTQDAIGEGFYRMAITVALSSTILLLTTFVVFQAKPPNPPSSAQHKLLYSAQMHFYQSIKMLLWNKDYLLLLLAYGIHSGVLITIAVLLNQIVLENHPNAAVDAGRLGLCFMFTGIGSGVVSGMVLDKFKQFRKTFIAVYVNSLVGLIVFSFTVDKQLAIVYPGVIITGFLMSAVFAIGYEVGAELTYPVPEGTSGGIITAVANVFAISFTYLYSIMTEHLSSKMSNLVMFVLLVVGLMLVLCMRFEQRRQKLQVHSVVP